MQNGQQILTGYPAYNEGTRMIVVQAALADQIHIYVAIGDLENSLYLYHLVYGHPS